MWWQFLKGEMKLPLNKVMTVLLVAPSSWKHWPKTLVFRQIKEDRGLDLQTFYYLGIGKEKNAAEKSTTQLQQKFWQKLLFEEF